VIRVSVAGVPAPKGSFRISSRGRGRRPVVRKDSPKTEAWEVAVGWAARMAMRGQTMFIDQALAVDVVFRLPRPRDHYVHPAGNLIRRSKDEAAPSVKPDIDKLLRSTLDPMEGLVYDQDSRVVVVTAEKRYVRSGEEPGATIRVGLRNDEAWG
jgi:Holliday junction resolvase RusA-like endonuclease